MALVIDAALGQFTWSFALADRSEKSDTFGANVQPINCIFYVADFDHDAVLTPNGSPYEEVRIGSMFTFGGMGIPHQ